MIIPKIKGKNLLAVVGVNRNIKTLTCSQWGGVVNASLVDKDNICFMTRDGKTRVWNVITGNVSIISG